MKLENMDVYPVRLYWEKGPRRPFGEKTEKLIRFIIWELKRRPRDNNEHI